MAPGISWFDFARLLFMRVYKKMWSTSMRLLKKMMERIRVICRSIPRDVSKQSDISKINVIRHFENRHYVFKPTEIILNSSFDKRICEFLTGDATPINKALMLIKHSKRKRQRSSRFKNIIIMSKVSWQCHVKI